MVCSGGPSAPCHRGCCAVVLMLFTLVLAFIWLCVELQAQFYPAAFPVFVAAAVYVLAEQRTKTALFLLTVLTVVWVEVSVGTWWHSNRWPRVYVDHVYVTVGLAVLVFGFRHERSQRRTLAGLRCSVTLLDHPAGVGRDAVNEF